MQCNGSHFWVRVVSGTQWWYSAQHCNPSWVSVPDVCLKEEFQYVFFDSKDPLGLGDVGHILLYGPGL